MTFLAKSFAVSSVSALCVALLACSSSSKSVTMADAFDLDIFGPHTDDLHSPYVAGAAFDISVTSDGSGDQTGWTLSSSDPSVIRVTSQLWEGNASVSAVNPGSATLSVLDASGTIRDSHTVTVAIPDQVSLYAQGLLLTGASDPSAQVSQVSIVTGGEATFLARYFVQGTELYGNGVLTSSATGGITTATVAPAFAADRDFLHVTLPQGGEARDAGTVTLEIAHVAVAEIPVAAVDPAAVTHVTIVPQPTDNPKTGDSLVLYAHAVDADGGDVYGASFRWTVDGQSAWAEPGDGGVFDSPSVASDGPADLFFYAFDGTVTETVSAAYDHFDPSFIVHAQGGTVGSTAQVGCSAAGVGNVGGGGAVAAALGLVAAVGVARRRRRGA